ncbi:hypothetical protein AB0D27_42665 [Streptomyces sp. NPDC048415]|uniref:hypothetical protein n=1 Tax=Streptomyces sp. NPDC048415 TaxID=3154822 RepID=UPI0034445F64
MSGIADGLPGPVRCPAVLGDDRASGCDHMQVVLAEPDPDRDLGAGQPWWDGAIVPGEGHQPLRADGPHLFQIGWERAGRQLEQRLGLGKCTDGS